MLSPNDANLREAGSYDPAAGKGLTTETDSGNFAGSLLLLAMLLPDTYGVEGADPLGIFGTPPPAGLIAVSSGCARSSVGVDNRRCNAIEGLLNLWQHDAALRGLREKVLGRGSSCA